MTFFRNVVWFCKGLKEYTKSGFETASKKFKSSDLDVDCHGLSYMITGANSGLGKQVRLSLHYFYCLHLHLHHYFFKFDKQAEIFCSL